MIHIDFHLLTSKPLLFFLLVLENAHFDPSAHNKCLFPLFVSSFCFPP